MKNKLAKGAKYARNAVADLKSKGASAVGVAGFCWRGMTVSKLSSFSEIKAAVILHPGPLSDDYINAIKVDNFVKIYPGVTHGWTVRYKHDDEHVVKYPFFDGTCSSVLKRIYSSRETLSAHLMGLGMVALLYDKQDILFYLLVGL
ncbi:endo-1,3;1,4-beta-D-glucanase-like protein [Tanacetum coccineum]